MINFVLVSVWYGIRLCCDLHVANPPRVLVLGTWSVTSGVRDDRTFWELAEGYEVLGTALLKKDGPVE